MTVEFGVKYVCMFLLTGLEMILFSGTYFGYNAIVPYLKDTQGIFNQNCQINSSELQSNATMNANGVIICDTQTVLLSRAFVTWIFVHALMGNLLGWLLDKFGFVPIKIIASIAFLTGYLCLAFSLQVNWLIFLGGSFLAVNGHSLITSNASIARLFGKRKNTFMSMSSSLYGTSMIVMTVFASLLDIGANYTQMLASFGAFGAVVIISTIFLYRKDLKKFYEEGKVNEQLKAKEQINPSNQMQVVDELEQIKLDYRAHIDNTYTNYKKTLLSKSFLFNFLFFVMTRYRYTYFIAQLTSQTEYLFDKPTSKMLSNHFNLFVVIGIFSGPLFGYLMDKYQSYVFRKIYNSGIDVTGRYTLAQIQFCYFAPCLIELCCLLLSSVLIFIPNVRVFYLIFTLVSISRTLMMCINSSYLIMSLPNKFYGINVSVTLSLSGFIVLTQQAYMKYSTGSTHANLINGIMIGLIIIGYIHTGFLLLRKYRADPKK